METLILIVHVIAVILLIVLVLLQQGKGANVGAAFGSGASSTMFGSQGSFSFLMKLTYALAFTFFLTSLMLTYFSYQKTQGQKSLIVPDNQQTSPIPIPENRDERSGESA